MQNLEEYQTVKRWLTRLSPNTASVNSIVLDKFMEWLQDQDTKFSTFTPDQLIEYQRNCDNGSRYEIVDLLQSYLSDIEYSYNYMKRIRSTVRSFFMHNRAELPRDPSYIIRTDVEVVRGNLKIEEIRDMVLSCNKTYRAVFLSMFQGAMDVSSFEYWNLNGYEDLKAQLKEEKEIIKVELPGRKLQRNVTPYHTWIGPDSVQAIRDYLKERPDSQGAIFINKDGNPVNKYAVKLYWLRHLDQLDIIDRKQNGDTGTRYGKNLHELRDTFRTQWEKSPAKGSVAEYLMGHVVDPLEYNKAFRDEAWTLSEYKKALPMLQIMSSSTPYGKVDLSTVERLRRENQELRRKMEQDQQAQVEVYKRVESQQKQINEIMERLKAQENKL